MSQSLTNPPPIFHLFIYSVMLLYSFQKNTIFYLVAAFGYPIMHL